jgi:hypothetical protein
MGLAGTLVAIAIGIAFWAVAVVVRGSLIAGVNQLELGEDSNLGTAWNPSWQRIGRLFGIALLRAIPVLIIWLILTVTLVALVGVGVWSAFGRETPEGILSTIGLGTATVFLVIFLFGVVNALILDIFRGLANRACMLEDAGVFESYGRAWQVFRQNFGPALAFFVVQLLARIVVAIVFIIVAIPLSPCCFLWPLMMATNGGITAFFSALWTLAWYEWAQKPALATDDLPDLEEAAAS